MAKSFGRMLLGRDIEGIWHTGIEVYGKEYYYGGGICQGKPKQTPYGFPIKEIDMGETEIPKEIFTDFLKEISPKFAMEKYDLFDNNCNNFTNECCEFLTGKPLPDYIIGLPKEVLGTPLGQMIKPMITQMQNNMTQNANPMFAPEGQNSQQSMNSGFGGGSNGNQQSSNSEAVIDGTNMFEFNNLITTNKAVIVNFFSFTCQPCMVIKPVYEALARDYAVRCPELKFIRVNTGAARDIATKFAISSVPTFIGFANGKSIERFSGANKQKIESLIYQLEKRCNEAPSGGDTDVSKTLESLAVGFNIFNPAKKDPFIFVPDNFEVPIKKITTVTESDPKFSSAPTRKLFIEFAQNPKTNLKNFKAEDKGYLVTWIAETLFYIGISDSTLPFIDMLRILVTDPGFAESFITKSPERIEEFFNYMDKKDEELVSMQRGLKMIILRLLTNISAYPQAQAIFGNQTGDKFKKLIRITRALKDDRASNYACLMLLFNLIISLQDNKEYKENRKDLQTLMLELLKNENEEKNQLALVVNLLWLIYDSTDLKAKVKESIDSVKLARMERSENSALRMATQDLIQLIENKL